MTRHRAWSLDAVEGWVVLVPGHRAGFLGRIGWTVYRRKLDAERSLTSKGVSPARYQIVRVQVRTEVPW